MLVRGTSKDPHPMFHIRTLFGPDRVLSYKSFDRNRKFEDQICLFPGSDFLPAAVGGLMNLRSQRGQLTPPNRKT
jgi:hypothetical protein